VNCAACGVENRAGAKFCSECGAGLALVCPNGHPVVAGARFCDECGAAIASSSVASARDAPAAERRLVSVLFADLVGFTSASEARDAEDTRELLSRYFDTCRRLIELYGGTVEKFIGDAVMAVWGTPTATEDDAERAVRAALDLVAAVTALGDEVGVPDLRVRAAVMTGEAAVTLGAEGQGMVAGDLVNTASRIQSLAEPGTVLVGEATRRATEQTVAYDDAGSHELKGKVGLIPLWRALRIVSGVGGTLKSAGLEAPFVGRDRELRQIKEIFHTSADETKAHLVSVTGIAGIGKSRLGWEFYKYFDGIVQITYWHRGRCLSYGEGVTYWALADMVRMRARIAEDEEEGSALAKLREVVEEHISDPEERRFVEPRLAHLIAVEEDGGRYERDDLFAAWRIFFERLAAVYPVVMLFEDMQWADASLLDFIEYLLEWARNSPILVVTQARPELLERRHTWGAGHRNFTSMYLEPLSGDAMEELLAGLVPGLPDELRAKILARAEGVPLYAVETVRMLLDRGALVQEGSVYRLAGTIESLEVPETLHALIAARLDGFPPAERRVVQDAAVLGKTFTKQALASLTDQPQAELESTLSSLARKEVFGVQSDPRSPEHGQYGFLQDLLRKVAYETLAKADRKTRHLAAAAFLEQNLGEHEVVEVVASHYLAAYEAAPDAEDAGAIRTKAGDQLARAGERAASLGAAEEGERYFAQAAELADDPLTEAELEERAGRMAWLGARTEQARTYLGRSLAVFEVEGLTRRAARIQPVLAEMDHREGHPPEAIARLESALEALAGEDDADTAAVAAQLGRFLVLGGREEEAGPRLERALELAEALRLPEVFTQALTSKSLLFSNRNRLEEGRILLEGALERALANDLHSAAMRALNNLAVNHESSDRYRDAARISARGLDLARRVGDRVWENAFLLGPLSSLVLIGDWDEALARVGEQIESLPEGDAVLALHVVVIDCARGDLGTARGRLEALRTAKNSDDPQARLGYAFAEAHVLRAEGALREALAVADSAREYYAGVTFLTVKLGIVEALEAAFALGDRPRVEELLASIDALRPGECPPLLKAHAHRFRAKLAGDPDGYAAAAALFRELQVPFELAVTLLEHGEATDSAGLVAEARELFERLGATPWLERAEGMIASPAEVTA
jgi:class 3 adenylate cyclase/tetratricopeptide (TPR) repeat protein